MNLPGIQRVRKHTLQLLTLTVVAWLSVTEPQWLDEPGIAQSVRLSGLLAIVVCIVGRTWASLYIGGRKTTELVSQGPYSIVRNPLYVFSMLGAAGAGLCTGALLPGLVLFLITWLVFSQVVKQEEAYLLDMFGESYRQYCIAVPRFWPRFGAWQSMSSDYLVNVDKVQRTFLEACGFLLALPITALIATAQQQGVLPVIFQIP